MTFIGGLLMGVLVGLMLAGGMILAMDYISRWLETDE